MESLTPMSLFIGFGLALFLTLTNSWFGEFLSTALTLFFAGAGIFLANHLGWRRTFARSRTPLPHSCAFYAVGFVLWLLLPLYYFLGPPSTDLHLDLQAAHAYLADPSCSDAALRALARQPAALDFPVAQPDSRGQPICTVRWTRATGRSVARCVPLDDGRTVRDYCLMSMWQLDTFDRRTIHPGDWFVAQTAFGRPSAFFFPSTRLVTRVFYPWGQIPRTRNHPEEVYIVHLMTTFWPLFFYLILGSAFFIGLVRAVPRLS